MRDKVDRNGKKSNYVIECGHCCRQGTVRDTGPRLLKMCVERTGAFSAPRTVKVPSSHKGQRLPAKNCSQPFILFSPRQTLVTSSTFSIPVPQLQSCKRKMCRQRHLHSYPCPCYTILFSAVVLGFQSFSCSPNSYTYHSLTSPFLIRYPSIFSPKGLRPSRCASLSGPSCSLMALTLLTAGGSLTLVPSGSS